MKSSKNLQSCPSNLGACNRLLMTNMQDELEQKKKMVRTNCERYRHLGFNSIDFIVYSKLSMSFRTKCLEEVLKIKKAKLTVIHDGCSDIFSGESLSPSSFYIQIQSRFSSVLTNVFLSWKKLSLIAILVIKEDL